MLEATKRGKIMTQEQFRDLKFYCWQMNLKPIDLTCFIKANEINTAEYLLEKLANEFNRRAYEL